MPKFTGTLGTDHNAAPLSVKIHPDLKMLIDKLESKAPTIRRWIIEGMVKDKLITRKMANQFLGMEQ